MFLLSKAAALSWWSFCSFLVHVVYTAPTDSFYMNEAVGLSLRAEGRTRPNPLVGCVVVNSTSNEIVGRGWHHMAGGPHAEVWALRDCGPLSSERRPKDLTAYVTLEPCNHFGRTPPCTRALCAAGVSRVVVALLDTDTRVAGKGIEFLRSQNVSVDLLQTRAEPESDRVVELCARGNAPFLFRAKCGRPLLQRLVLEPSTRLSSSGAAAALDWLNEPSEFWARVCALQDTFVVDAPVTASWLRRRPHETVSGAMQALRDLTWRLHTALARHMRLVVCLSEADLRSVAGVDDAAAWLAAVADKSSADTDRRPDEVVFALFRDGRRRSPGEEDGAGRGVWCMHGVGDSNVQQSLGEWCAARLQSNGVSLLTAGAAQRSAEPDDEEEVMLCSLSDEAHHVSASDGSEGDVAGRLMWRRVLGRRLLAHRPRLLPLHRLLLSPQGEGRG